jgi:hypothetical protein
MSRATTCSPRRGLGLGQPLAANAYLGAWGIAECLSAGADVVVTARVTDASLVLGPAAAHFGWTRDDDDRSAGAVVAGTCSSAERRPPVANYAFFGEIADPVRPASDRRGTRRRQQRDHQAPRYRGCRHRRHRHRPAPVRDRGPATRGPDVTARFDTIRLEGRRADRVRISGVAGDSRPADAQGGLPGARRLPQRGAVRGSPASTSKRRRPRAPPARRRRAPGAEWTLVRTDRADATPREEASAVLRCVVRAAASRADRPAPFTGAAIELASGQLSRLTTSSIRPPGSHYGVFPASPSTPRSCPHAVLPDAAGVNSRRDAGRTKHCSRTCPKPPLPPPLPPGHVRRAPWARSPGPAAATGLGSANVGCWSAVRGRWRWLAHALTSQEFGGLLPETAACRFTRHLLPHLAGAQLRRRRLLREGVAPEPGSTPRPRRWVNGCGRVTSTSGRPLR